MKSRLVIIIEASDLEAANTAALAFDVTGGSHTFVAGLSADGSEPATHYWTSFLTDMPNGFRQIAASQFPSAVVYEDVTDNPNFPNDCLAQSGLMRLMIDTRL